MRDPLLEMAAEAVGRVLERKDITRPIHTLTFVELMEIADAVLKAWQRAQGCTDELDVPFDAPGGGR
jgi:hypothetical protein